MNSSGAFAGAEDHFSAGLEELKRGVAALAQNSARPHKQLVQRGNFVYTTGNVLHRAPATVHYSSILSEIEAAIALGNAPAQQYGRWQDNEPALDRSKYEVNVKAFALPTSATLQSDIPEVVAAVCAARGTDYIDTLTVAAPPLSGVDFDALLDAWAAAESLVHMGTVRSLAVSGLDDAGRLHMLMAHARVRPVAIYVAAQDSSSNQSAAEVILAAHQYELRVLVDGDAHVEASLLTARGRLSAGNPTGRFGSAFHQALVPPFAQTSFTALAAARYTVFVPARSIVIAKGYAVKSKYLIA